MTVAGWRSARTGFSPKGPDRAPPPELARDGNPVLTGHIHIEDRKIDGPLGHQLPKLRTAGRLAYGKSVPRKIGLDEAPQVLLVINHHDVGILAHAHDYRDTLRHRNV